MFLLSALQNMLANVISISNIYTSIDHNIQIVNDTGVHYDLARLTRILVIFDPIEPVEDDYVYVPSYDDPDLNRLWREDKPGFTDFLTSLLRQIIQAFPKPTLKP